MDENAYSYQIKLTLNMLMYLKDYKIYIHSLNRILELAWAKYMEFSHEQQYMLSVLRRQ